MKCGSLSPSPRISEHSRRILGRSRGGIVLSNVVRVSGDFSDSVAHWFCPEQWPARRQQEMVREGETRHYTQWVGGFIVYILVCSTTLFFLSCLGNYKTTKKYITNE